MRVRALEPPVGDDEHPIKRLARLALPEPLHEADVQGDYDRWVRENVPNEVDRNSLLDLYGTPTPTAREHALFELLSILETRRGAWPRGGRCDQVIQRVEEIKRQLAPSDPVMSHVRAKAAAYVTEGYRRVRSEPVHLLSFLEGAPLRVSSDGTVALAFEVTAPFSDFVLDFRNDAFALHRLRSMLEGDPSAFDAAVLAQAGILALALESGIGRLFESCAPPQRIISRPSGTSCLTKSGFLRCSASSRTAPICGISLTAEGRRPRSGCGSSPAPAHGDPTTSGAWFGSNRSSRTIRTLSWRRSSRGPVLWGMWNRRARCSRH